MVVCYRVSYLERVCFALGMLFCCTAPMTEDRQSETFQPGPPRRNEKEKFKRVHFDGIEVIYVL